MRKPYPSICFFSGQTETGVIAHNLERATSMHSYHGVFRDQFIFSTVLARMRISFKSHKPVSKTYRPKNDNFCLLMTLSSPF